MTCHQQNAERGGKSSTVTRGKKPRCQEDGLWRPLARSGSLGTRSHLGVSTPARAAA